MPIWTDERNLHFDIAFALSKLKVRAKPLDEMQRKMAAEQIVKHLLLCGCGWKRSRRSRRTARPSSALEAGLLFCPPSSGRAVRHVVGKALLVKIEVPDEQDFQSLRGLVRATTCQRKIREESALTNSPNSIGVFGHAPYATQWTLAR